MPTYTGKTVVVTGASSGIGRALCLEGGCGSVRGVGASGAGCASSRPASSTASR